MPEYERQLRAAARRLAGDPEPSAKPLHGGLGARLFLGLTGAIAVAVIVAAIVLIGHRAPSGVSSPGSSLPAIQYDCAPHQVLRTVGQLVPSAHGAVRGQRWTLEVDSGRQGLASVQAGRLVLGGRAYGFCATRLDLELVNAGPQGLVYGLAAAPYRPPIVVEATTARGTAANPVPAAQYLAATRQVPGATLFLRALPASACAYDALALAVPQRATSAGAGNTTLAMTGPFTRSCAPGQLRQTPQLGAGPGTPQIAPPPGLSAPARAQYDAGRAEVGRSGCLACHQIGAQGNNGPGPNLTHIGSVLSARTLKSTLLNPTPPMPSYRNLPAHSRRAIVVFLQALR
jgi:hypothetical protein